MHIFYICFVASLDSTAQTGTINVGDWQEEVYQKVICSFFAHLIAPTSGGLKGCGAWFIIIIFNKNSVGLGTN